MAAVIWCWLVGCAFSFGISSSILFKKGGIPMKKEGKFNHEQHVYVDISQVYHPIHPSKEEMIPLYIALSDTCNAACGLPRTNLSPCVQGSEKATTLESQRKQSNARWKWTKLLTSLRGESYQLPIIPGFMLDFDKVGKYMMSKIVVHIYIYLEYGFGLHHLSWIWFTHVMGKCVGKVDDLTI